MTPRNAELLINFIIVAMLFAWLMASNRSSRY